MEKYVVRNIERPSKAILDAYNKLDVSTVYEAQGKQGILDPELKPILKNTMIVGPAVTVVCPAGDNLMIHAAIEVVKPGDIVVITTEGNNVIGMVGELIVTALMKKGAKGIIMDSGIRDVRQIRDMGFPIWTREVLSQGAQKGRGGWVNAPAVCAGILIHPGDLIMADDDGVVVVKKEDFESSLKLSQARVAKEAGTIEKIESGQISLDFYNLRPVLASEGVVYYETEEERLAAKEGVANGEA
ncbi:4-carboxy-4-hydroxy-2-oxoadipate aldolase/oxaloacetate decarboxylase [Lysinibacillus sp. NPDC097279]|uniref:4-carboxy-4-hydroxy-2-oxoadipate aldolase/oxaloacetate decarboxylase n=1 Tax=Lysinibacillus sp. NPDC097279 TaxID=3364143 RepID=UPI00381C68CD